MKLTFETKAIIIGLLVAAMSVCFYALIFIFQLLRTEPWPWAKIDRSILIGSYKAHLEGRTHYLELKSDRTYVHRFTNFEGREIENFGIWDLYKHPKTATRVHLENFVTGIKYFDSQDLDPNGFSHCTYSAYIEKPLFGKLRLVIFYDWDFYFVKEKTEK